MATRFSPSEYDKFFREVSLGLRNKLPQELGTINIYPLTGHNYMVIRFPVFINSWYELHFSSRSGNHATYFGEGPHDVIAFYFKGTLDRRSAWLDTLKPHIPQIEQALGFPVVSGNWGKTWAWLAVKLNCEARDPERYTGIMAGFIEATYKPIQEVFHSIEVEETN